MFHIVSATYFEGQQTGSVWDDASKLAPADTIKCSVIRQLAQIVISI